MIYYNRFTAVGPSCQQVEKVISDLFNYIVQQQIIPDSVRLGKCWP